MSRKVVKSEVGTVMGFDFNRFNDSDGAFLTTKVSVCLLKY